MSEKLQHTALRTQLLMQDRYGDTIHHKHDKCHFTYRAHHPSHPSKSSLQANGHDLETSKNSSTGQIHQIKLRKIRKRLAKGFYH